MHLSEEKLIKIADLMASLASYRDIIRAVGISESLLYHWRAQCERDRKAQDFSSAFYIPFRGEMMFWTQACSIARREHLATAESILRKQAVEGVEEIVRTGLGETVYKKNPLYIGRDDDFVQLSEGCTESDVEWHRLLHDADGNPIPETVMRQVPAQLRVRVLEASHVDYVAKSQVDVRHSGEVQVHTAKPLERKPGETAPNIAELKRLARLTPEQRRAELGASAFPMDARGLRTIPALPPKLDKDLPDDQGRGLKPAPQVYTPPPKVQPAPAPAPAPAPRPPYAKPARALDQASRGEGEPPPGGFSLTTGRLT